MWGKRVVCGEAGTGLGRQGRGRVWLCSGGAAKARYALHGLRLKPVTFAMFLTILLKCEGGVNLEVGQCGIWLVFEVSRVSRGQPRSAG